MASTKNKARRAWTAEEVERLRALLSSGMTPAACARALGRPHASAWEKAREIAGKAKPTPKPRPERSLRLGDLVRQGGRGKARGMGDWRKCVVSRAEFERLGGTGIPEMLAARRPKKAQEGTKTEE